MINCKIYLSYQINMSVVFDPNHNPYTSDDQMFDPDTVPFASRDSVIDTTIHIPPAKIVAPTPSITDSTGKLIPMCPGCNTSSLSNGVLRMSSDLTLSPTPQSLSPQSPTSLTTATLFSSPPVVTKPVSSSGMSSEEMKKWIAGFIVAVLIVAAVVYMMRNKKGKK